MAARRVPLALVIFDCDGVLIDSEAVAARVVAAALASLGWTLTAAEAQHLFVGMTLTDLEPLIAARTGTPVPPTWRRALTQSIMDAMATEAVMVPGALDALDAVEALGLPWRVASNSSHEELAAKFQRVGLSARMHGRVHSHRDVARGKPAPDLFLAAAAAQRVAPAGCVVIEDSAAGTAAAEAAGMDCLGYAPHGSGAELRAHGAFIFHAMGDLQHLLALATQGAA